MSQTATFREGKYKLCDEVWSINNLWVQNATTIYFIMKATADVTAI